MAEVKDERITNKMVRENFYNIQYIRSIVAARVLLFIGKVIWTDDESSMPKQLLTSWVNHKRPVGRPLTTNKTSIVKSLQILYPNTMDKFGSLKLWRHDAMHKKRWEWMIDSHLRFPHLDIPEPRTNPSNNPPCSPPRSPPRRTTSTPPSSPPRPSTPP